LVGGLFKGREEERIEKNAYYREVQGGSERGMNAPPSKV